MSHYQYMFKIISDNQKLEKEEEKKKETYLQKRKKQLKKLYDDSFNFQLKFSDFNEDKELVDRYNKFFSMNGK